MSRYDPNRHHRRSIRLRGYDYTQAGAYFVTIVTQDREPLFGDVVDGEMVLSAYGRVAATMWQRIPRHFPHVELDEWVVMPNHVHGVIVIMDARGGGDAFPPKRAGELDAAHGETATASRVPDGECIAPTAGSPPGSLGAVVGNYKSVVTRRINQMRKTSGVRVWQRNYYERIIRNERELNAIRQYVYDNPVHWHADTENPEATQELLEEAHLETKLITGNEAVALGALRAGVKVVSGYPGTPSTGALTCLLAMDLDDGRHVEWSTNEKVAFEIAAGAAWAGQRALCTMKMSGVNVAYDSLISIAYSGVVGGLVIYVADDPGVSAGMAEQDSRGFALMSDLPMLEPSSVAEAYRLVQAAFEVSERAGTPVFCRSVTAIAQAKAAVQVEQPIPPAGREPQLLRDIARFTKAGAAICKQQHRDLIARLEKAGDVIREMGLNRLRLAGEKGGLGIVASGVTASYLEEGLEVAGQNQVSVLEVVATHPFPTQEVKALLRHCDAILVLEELEPHIERGVYVEAHRLGFEGRIVGKLDGTFERVGEYGVDQVVRGVGTAVGETGFFSKRSDRNLVSEAAEQLAAARPITVCAGCPHRGTFIAINQAIKELKLKKDEVMVTGDIGCTILGMNPPFHTVWNEVAMGASLGIAQGHVHAGVETPVIATIGDSTFFHAGIPSLVNAVQHQAPLTLVIMDNGWTSMTGMQVNPSTGEAFQRPGDRQVDIARIVPALGVEHFFVVDPFDLDETTAVIQKALTLPGVKVVLARQECAIQAMRRGVRAGEVEVVAENCILCKRCIRVTGCPAIGIGTESTVIDPALCYGCGLCADVCPHQAIVKGGAQ